MKHLTPKQQLFVIEYLKDFNATQAAIRAGYSKKTARSQAQRLLTNVDISKAIQGELEARKAKARLKVEDLQDRLHAIIDADITNIVSFNESGVSFVQNSDDIPNREKYALKSVEVIESHHGDDQMTLRTKVKMHDKLKAIELYGKTIGAFTEKLKTGEETYEERLRKRIEERKALGKRISPW